MDKEIAQLFDSQKSAEQISDDIVKRR